MAGSLFFAARIIFTRRSYALPKGGEAVARLRGAAALFFPVFFGAALLFFPDVSAAAAREGVTLCLQTVLPSLFPFFVLSSLLVQSDVPRLLSRAMAGVMYPLFGVSGAGASALILGLLGGYPDAARSLGMKPSSCSRSATTPAPAFFSACAARRCSAARGRERISTSFTSARRL